MMDFKEVKTHLSNAILAKLSKVASSGMPGKRIIHLHIRKTGGLSLVEALRRAYGVTFFRVNVHASREARSMLPEVHAAQNRAVLMAYMAASPDNYRCISAICPFNNDIHSKLKNDWKFITVLRDPIKRFVSHYYDQAMTCREGASRKDFLHFMDSDLARRYACEYTRYFSGKACSSSQFVYPEDSEMVNKAIDNINQFDLVGDLSLMTKFQSQLSRIVDRNIKIKHRNKRRDRTSTDVIIQKDDWSRIEELCKWDVYFYNEVMKNRAEFK
jgi:hypothetical protein